MFLAELFLATTINVSPLAYLGSSFKVTLSKTGLVISCRVSPGQTGCKPAEASTYQADIWPTSSLPTKPSTEFLYARRHISRVHFWVSHGIPRRLYKKGT